MDDYVHVIAEEWGGTFTDASLATIKSKLIAIAKDKTITDIKSAIEDDVAGALE